jgi:hypothetical protein
VVEVKTAAAAPRTRRDCLRDILVSPCMDLELSSFKAAIQTRSSHCSDIGHVWLKAWMTCLVKSVA